jgi:hypothetical protein
MNNQAGARRRRHKWVAGMVDETHSAANNQSSDRTVRDAKRDGESRREAAGESCTWAKATNFTQFVNDREQHDKSDSVSYAKSQGTFFDVMSDRSYRAACGWNRETSTRKSKGIGYSRGSAFSWSSRDSKSGGHTGPMIAFGPVTPAGYELSLNFPFLTYNGGTQPGGEATVAQCGAPNPPDGIPCENISPSGGWEWNTVTTVSASVSIGPPPINVSLKWDIALADGASVSNREFCSFGRTCSSGQNQSSNQATSNTSSKSESDQLVEDYSSDVHDVHRVGETHRQTESQLDSLATAGMRAASEHHTGSDSSGHGQSENKGTGESNSEWHTRSKSEGKGESTSTMSARYWDNISKALGELWKRITMELETLKNQLRHSYMPAILPLTACNNRIVRNDARGYAVFQSHIATPCVFPAPAKRACDRC